MTTLIQETSMLKNSYEQDFNILNLMNSIAKTSKNERVKALLGGEQNLIMKFNNNREDNTLFGLFDCPYHPNMNLEALKYEKMLPNILLPEFNINLVNAIKVVDGTKGIVDQEVVAVFPENFYNHKVSKTDSIFYFADKFAARHLKYTRIGIELFGAEDFFKPIMTLKQDELEQLATNWFHIHEYFHRTGFLPLPTYLVEKSNRITAGFEELRVDLETIRYLDRQSQNEDDDYYKTMLFVLSERLIGYPLFRDIEQNFDAFSSFVFLQALLEKKYLKLNREKLITKINHLLSFINKTEKEALESFSENSERKAFLISKYREVLKEANPAKELFIQNKRKLP